MKLGIGSYSCMWSIGFPGAAPEAPMDAFDLIQQAKRLQVRLVQFGPNLSLAGLSSRRLPQLVEQARESQIELEMGTRGLATEHIQDQLLIARRAGVLLLRTIPELPGGAIPSPRVLENSLRTLAPYLEDAGIRLALENSRIPACEIASVLDAVVCPLIGITLDTVNSFAIAEGTRHVTETLARYVMCLHVKDFRVERMWHMMGFRVEGTPAGQGQLNVPWLLDTLTTAGAKFNAILELWPPEQETLPRTIALERAWMDESISYLRRYIAE